VTPDKSRDEPVGTLAGARWGEVPSPAAAEAPAEGAGSCVPPIGPGDSLPPVPLAEATGFYHRWGKRALDIAGALLALILISPLWALIAVAIKLNTPGPVLYRSWRVGEGGRQFRFLKFRSMVHGAEAIRDSLTHLNEADGPVFKIARDPRITAVGSLLRKTSLDELPQFWNILVGDMALVGPRPPILDEVVQYESWQLRRLSVRPGLTCLWQISGRSRIGFDEWMRLDMEYINHRSFRLDLKILLLTIPAVLTGKGAY
jgi:lipopolysaccharide/colanic/teichoic acid biosynthesis glycosyltransferase